MALPREIEERARATLEDAGFRVSDDLSNDRLGGQGFHGKVVVQARRERDGWSVTQRTVATADARQALRGLGGVEILAVDSGVAGPPEMPRWAVTASPQPAPGVRQGRGAWSWGKRLLRRTNVVVFARTQAAADERAKLVDTLTGWSLGAEGRVVEAVPIEPVPDARDRSDEAPHRERAHRASPPGGHGPRVPTFVGASAMVFLFVASCWTTWLALDGADPVDADFEWADVPWWLVVVFVWLLVVAVFERRISDLARPIAVWGGAGVVGGMAAAMLWAIFSVADVRSGVAAAAITAAAVIGVWDLGRRVGFDRLWQVVVVVAPPLTLLAGRFAQAAYLHEVGLPSDAVAPASWHLIVGGLPVIAVAVMTLAVALAVYLGFRWVFGPGDDDPARDLALAGAGFATVAVVGAAAAATLTALTAAAAQTSGATGLPGSWPGNDPRAVCVRVLDDGAAIDGGFTIEVATPWALIGRSDGHVALWQHSGDADEVEYRIVAEDAVSLDPVSGMRTGCTSSPWAG